MSVFAIVETTFQVCEGTQVLPPIQARTFNHRIPEKVEMADKSAFVPVDAIGNHKNTDLDVDIDDELFGKKPPKASPSATKAAVAPPAAVKPTSPAPKPAAPAAPGKYQYKKSATYQKAYAK